MHHHAFTLLKVLLMYSPESYSASFPVFTGGSVCLICVLPKSHSACQVIQLISLTRCGTLSHLDRTGASQLQV